MFRFVFFSIFVFSSGLSQADVWRNDRWKDNFFLGLWEGCVGKMYSASDYMKKNGVISGTQLRTTKDPELLHILNLCECQTEYFQDRYTPDAVKKILSNEASIEQIDKVSKELREKCSI